MEVLGSNTSKMSCLVQLGLNESVFFEFFFSDPRDSYEKASNGLRTKPARLLQ